MTHLQGYTEIQLLGQKIAGKNGITEFWIGKHTHTHTHTHASEHAQFNSIPFGGDSVVVILTSDSLFYVFLYRVMILNYSTLDQYYLCRESCLFTPDVIWFDSRLYGVSFCRTLLGGFGHIKLGFGLFDGWTWSDGQPMLVSHGYWSPGQPDLSQGQCIKMERSQLWPAISSFSVENCFQKLPFVCMKPPIFYNG